MYPIIFGTKKHPFGWNSLRISKSFSNLFYFYINKSKWFMSFILLNNIIVLVTIYEQ